jgi:SARP family transcriptional regulator, regulator of embCAB operon
MGEWTRARIQLCGHFVVDFDGSRVEDTLPGRRGRLLFAYLDLNRGRALPRDELLLPQATFVDVEAALEGAHRAESAVAEGRWAQAWGPAGIAYHVATRAFLTGLEAPWIDQWRRRLQEVRLRGLECFALMEALARRGNLAEALRAYGRLRVLLREELGVAPRPELQAVHRRLLRRADDQG